MPIIDPFAPPPAKDAPTTEEPRLVICTLDPKHDNGPECPLCGWPSGAGHGRRR